MRANVIPEGHLVYPKGCHVPVLPLEGGGGRGQAHLVLCPHMTFGCAIGIRRTLVIVRAMCTACLVLPSLPTVSVSGLTEFRIEVGVHRAPKNEPWEPTKG